MSKTARGSRAGSSGAASIAASVGVQDNKKRIVNIWPEWSDADVNAEKWEAVHRGGKKEEKGKSPVVQHFFDDPEGKIEMPPIFKVDHWNRPQDFVVDKTITIVEDETKFDLMSANEHVHESELMRWITSQIQALWRLTESKTQSGSNSPVGEASGDQSESSHTWRPWEHIYAFSKISKGPNIPVYNPHGKYVVKLYWMGCWRKIIIDDTMPFDDQERLLLPATTLQQELWPMLLAKALIKVASLDWNGGSSNCEFGDFSVIQCLTGWLPETIPLQYGHVQDIWNLLKTAVHEFKLPELKPSTPADGETADNTNMEGTKDEKLDKEKSSEKPDSKSKDGKEKDKGKEKEKGKDDKKDKKDKDKDKGKEKSIVPEEAPLPEHPEVVVFASYSGPPKYPVRVSVLSEMADASERLRQTGFSHMYPHPVLVTQTRSCPLEPPPPPEVIPAWKLIRPRKKRTTPSDEPIETVEEKPIQCVEVVSPFLNYKVSPVPIPKDVHRPKSSLERGSTRVSSRPGTANVTAIEEADENIPEAGDHQTQHSAEKTKGSEHVRMDDKESPKSTPSKRRSAGKSPSKSHVDVTTAHDVPAKSTKQAAPKSGTKRTGSAISRDRDSNKTTDTKVKDNKDANKDGRGTASQSVVTEGVTDVTLTPADNQGQGDAHDLSDNADQHQAQGSAAVESNAQQVWMDFENFCKCFKTLYIFHKPATYPCNYKHSDLKVPQEDKTPSYLFVDNLKPTEIVVSFSALCRWNEPPPTAIKEETKSTLKSRDKTSDRDSKAEHLTVDSMSIMESSSEPRSQEPLQPGLLVAEPYSWKSLVSGQPVLRLRSTATRAAVLSLPEGRHLLKFSMTAPLGYHIHLCSSTQFVFGDEEKVMEHLTKESCRFIDNAVEVMTCLGKCISSFSDAVLFTQAMDEYYTSHCPYRHDKHASKQHHFTVYNEAFYQMLRKVLSEANLATPEMAFAWRAFNFDVTTRNILGIHHGSSSRPATGVTTSDRGSAGGKKGAKKHSANPVVESGDTTEPKEKDQWKNREPTPEEHVASIKIQRNWRATYVRKIKTARTPGTEDNLKVQETLQKAWAVLEQNLEQNGLTLFRTMFKIDPDLMTKYPFYKDEWNKISYADYSGNFPEQPTNTWFTVFREIFYVSEEMLCVPKLYVPLSTCMLRVINNDNWQEIPRVFQKVAPHVYKKNKAGYTFLAEARSVEQPIPSGRWRVRLIGSLSPLPAPSRNEVNSSFHVRELRDYYVPQDKDVIFRYSVKVQDDHLVTLQMSTSKRDVYIKLQILDHEHEQISVTGKGHVILPAFIFQKDALVDEDSKRSNSRSSMKGKGSKDTGKGNKRSGSGRTSRSSHSRHSVSSLEEEEEKPHKYVIQAQVLRSSWPLSESDLTFVNMLKEMEKNETKLSQKDRAPSPARAEKQSASTAKGGKDKSGKAKGKEKEKTSRPASQQFDITKPNWTLKVISDGAQADDIEVKKDTEKADKIRAMKKAWEDAEPGRAAKALQSRLQYLNSHIIKARSEEDIAEDKSGEDECKMSITESPGSPVPPVSLDNVESETLVDTPGSPVGKEVLPLIDLTPFLRNSGENPRILDEEELRRQLEEKQKQIAAYRAYREEVERMRKQEKTERNLLKKKQLELCEQMQLALDAAREAVNNPREAYRQKLLEAEKRRIEEIAAQEAALRAEQDKPPSPKGRKSAKSGKTSGKKKK